MTRTNADDNTGRSGRPRADAVLDAYSRIMNLDPFSTRAHPAHARAEESEEAGPDGIGGGREADQFESTRNRARSDAETTAMRAAERGLLAGAAQSSINGSVPKWLPESPAPPFITVLGATDVKWCVAPDRKVLKELALYLVTHRDRPRSAEVLLEAIWPPTEDRDSADIEIVQQAISRLRRCLGGPSSISDAVTAGGYLVADSVRCDLTEFRRLLKAARHQTDPTLPLDQALSWVTGPPFSGLPKQGYAWVWSEFLPSRLTAEVVRAADQFATLCIRARDFDGAERACAQGLLASPAEEQLHEDRLRLTHAMGDRSRFETAWTDACGVLKEQAASGPVGATYCSLRERFDAPA